MQSQGREKENRGQTNKSCLEGEPASPHLLVYTNPCCYFSLRKSHMCSDETDIVFIWVNTSLSEFQFLPVQGKEKGSTQRVNLGLSVYTELEMLLSKINVHVTRLFIIKLLSGILDSGWLIAAICNLAMSCFLVKWNSPIHFLRRGTDC